MRRAATILRAWVFGWVWCLPLTSSPCTLFDTLPHSFPLALQASMRVNVAAAEKCSYETMVVLRPDLGDEARDSELAKFEAFLQKSGAEDIQVTIRGRQRLAYPIKSFADGIYVLYTYDASPQVVAPVQKLLSTPTAGAELNVLRHMTFRI